MVFAYLGKLDLSTGVASLPTWADVDVNGLTVGCNRMFEGVYVKVGLEGFKHNISRGRCRILYTSNNEKELVLRNNYNLLVK
jgi:hypothetical protein